jgi:hypothetical protein
MRRWLLDLHLYAGLICLPYIVLLGISSIALNHGIGSVTKRTWTARIEALADAAPDEQAQAVRRALGLHVLILGEEVKRTENGNLSFVGVRAGRRYKVSAAPDGSVHVAERDHGVLGILRALHGSRERWSSRWSFGWSLYTDVTIGVVLFLIVSGILLFAPRRGSRGLNVVATVSGLVVCIALAAFVW